MLKEMNKCLLISGIIGVIYAIYALCYFGGIVGNGAGEAIATALVTPHLVCVVLAVIFNWLGVLKNNRAFALTGAILYAVALVLFIPYFLFVILEIILSFVGFAQLKEEKVLINN